MWLAIETALAACSVALIDEDGNVVADAHELLGRGHAERLVPMIGEVLARCGGARPDRVAVDVGPGSFTGLRVGIAAARALGFAWGVPVAGYASTAVVAAAAFRSIADAGVVTIALDAARGEVYLQSFVRRGLAPASAPEAMSPSAAALAGPGALFAGPGAALIAAADPTARTHVLPFPAARDAALLPLSALSLAPRPVYVRPPDAKLPA